jgi:hypothetical protein
MTPLSQLTKCSTKVIKSFIEPSNYYMYIKECEQDDKKQTIRILSHIIFYICKSLILEYFE